MMARFTISLVILGSFAGVAQAASASPTPPLVVETAHYAFETAIHFRPARVVSALDVTSAALVVLTLVQSDGISLFVGLGREPKYPRMAAFMDSFNFLRYCVDFPDRVGAAPRLITCPADLMVLWGYEISALQASEMAIAAAARVGHAVSGADVVKFARKVSLRLEPTPTFTAGQGSVVRFTGTARVNNGPPVEAAVCVRLPKTAYGVPVLVAPAS